MADKTVLSKDTQVRTRYREAADGVYAPYQCRLVASGASIASVDASATSVTLKAANANRCGLNIYNDSDKALYVKYGATASAGSFTVKILAGGYFEMPEPIYTGTVDGIWAADPTGAARVTELY